MDSMQCDLIRELAADVVKEQDDAERSANGYITQRSITAQGRYNLMCDVMKICGLTMPKGE